MAFTKIRSQIKHDSLLKGLVSCGLGYLIFSLFNKAFCSTYGFMLINTGFHMGVPLVLILFLVFLTRVKIISKFCAGRWAMLSIPIFMAISIYPQVWIVSAFSYLALLMALFQVTAHTDFMNINFFIGCCFNVLVRFANSSVDPYFHNKLGAGLTTVFAGAIAIAGLFLDREDTEKPKLKPIQALRFGVYFSIFFILSCTTFISASSSLSSFPFAIIPTFLNLCVLFVPFNFKNNWIVDIFLIVGGICMAVPGLVHTAGAVIMSVCACLGVKYHIKSIRRCYIETATVILVLCFCGAVATLFGTAVPGFGHLYFKRQWALWLSLYIWPIIASIVEFIISRVKRSTPEVEQITEIETHDSCELETHAIVKKPFVLSFVAILAIVLTCFICRWTAVAPYKPAPTRYINVGSLNMLQGFNRDTGYYNGQNLTDVLAEHDIDIVGLQEAFTSDFFKGAASSIDYMSERLGLRAYHGLPATTASIGNAVLTSFNTRLAESDALPTSEETFTERIYVKEIFTIEGQEVMFLNVHLDFTGVDLPIQQAQHICKLANEFDGPVIAVGDFNHVPEHKVLKTVQECGFKIDAEIGNTEASYPDPEKPEKIDYIAIKNGKVHEGLVPTFSFVWAKTIPVESDHRFVAARLKLTFENSTI